MHGRHDPLTVRPALARDAAVIADLHQRSLITTYPELHAQPRASPSMATATWQERIAAREGIVLVALRDADLVGVVWCGSAPDERTAKAGLQVHSLHADPRHLGSGIGRTLLEAARSWMQEAGATQALLWVVETNMPARRFYERDGWVPDGASREERLSLPGSPGPLVRVIRLTRPLTAKPQTDGAGGLDD